MPNIIDRISKYLNIGDSMLSEETDETLHAQHVELQGGLRQYGKVHAKDPFIPDDSENVMEEGMKQHPLLGDDQRFDGTDLNLSAIPLENLDPEVRREIENQLRLQHRKKMEKQLGHTHAAAPKPQGM